MSLLQWGDHIEYCRLAKKKEPLTEAERQWLADYLLKEKLDLEEEDPFGRFDEDDADQGDTL